jgi:YfiH family protein
MNLKKVAKKMSVKNNHLILMYQTHSNKVIEIKKNNYKKKIRADAMLTKMRGIALGVVTADCVPILIYDRKNKIIGCIHAGWRGAISGVIKNTILKIRKLNSDNKIYATIGPCIGKESYEVDLKFFKNFVKKSKKNRKFFTIKNRNKKLFNLREYVAKKLSEQNVVIDHVNHDTFKERDNFFSYRRSTILNQRDYGRSISTIKLI